MAGLCLASVSKPVGVVDGVWIGDELAAQSSEFVVANRITQIINCCGIIFVFVRLAFPFMHV